MSSEYETLKTRYAAEILKRIRDNPQAFLDLDSSSERRGRLAKAKITPARRYGGRFGPAPEPTETQRALSAGLSGGFTFGLDDEIGAAMAAIPAVFDERDAGEIYDDELKRVRAETDYLQRQHPVAYGAGTVLGSLVQPATYVPAGWVGRGAALAGNAGKAANVATRSINLAKVGAIDGGVYGFNSGTGGLGNRLGSATQHAALGAAVAGSLPGAGQLAANVGGPILDKGGRLAAWAAEPLLDRLAMPIIKRITQDPREAAALLEKARALRLTNPNSSEADVRHALKTLYDSVIDKGKKTGDDLTIMHRALYNRGLGNAQISTTTDRIDRIGKAFVGPGYLSKRGGNALWSANKDLRYRRPSTKKKPHPSAKSNVQANLERNRRNHDSFHHNLHVDIFD